MRIGVDIDGVLTDIHRFQLDYGSKYAYENNVLNDIKLYKYYSGDCFDWGMHNEEIFWNKYIYDYSVNYPVRDFASEVINKLKNDGHEIYIITARVYTTEDSENGEKMRKIVNEWLKKNDIYYDKIIFSKEDKRKYLLENNIDIMIEDSPYNIMSLRTVAKKIICFDAGYNKECIGENIIRCYSWYDIYNKIKNI